MGQKLTNSLGRTKLTNSLGLTKLTNTLGRTKLANSLGRTKLTNCLGRTLPRETTTWTFLLTRDQDLLLETAANLWTRQSKENDFSRFYFWVGRYNNTLNNWSRGKPRVCFPSASMFPSASLRVNTQFVSCCKIHGGGGGGWGTNIFFTARVFLFDSSPWSSERVASCPGMFLMFFFLFYTANCILALQL